MQRVLGDHCVLSRSPFSAHLYPQGKPVDLIHHSHSVSPGHMDPDPHLWFLVFSSLDQFSRLPHSFMAAFEMASQNVAELFAGP